MSKLLKIMLIVCFMITFAFTLSYGIDLNLTSEKDKFSVQPSNIKMYRGCHVHRYYMDNQVEEYIKGNYKSNICDDNETNDYLVCQQIS